MTAIFEARRGSKVAFPMQIVLSHHQSIYFPTQAANLVQPREAQNLMPSYLLWRTINVLTVAAGITLLSFFLIHLAPGDPATTFLGIESDNTAIATLKQKLGLDRSLAEQYLRWLARILCGDFGRSTQSGRPVFSMMMDCNSGRCSGRDFSKVRYRLDALVRQSLRSIDAKFSGSDFTYHYICRVRPRTTCVRIRIADRQSDRAPASHHSACTNAGNCAFGRDNADDAKGNAG